LIATLTSKNLAASLAIVSSVSASLFNLSALENLEITLTTALLASPLFSATKTAADVNYL